MDKMSKDTQAYLDSLGTIGGGLDGVGDELVDLKKMTESKDIDDIDFKKLNEKLKRIDESLNKSFENSSNKYNEALKANKKEFEESVNRINKEFRNKSLKKAALYGLGTGLAAGGVYYLDKKYRKDSLPI